MPQMLNCRKMSPSCRAQVLVTVPSRLLLEQFADEMTSFCKVGTGYNKKIDFASRGFISVTDSVQLLQKLKFEACFVDEGHHPLPPDMPRCKDLFKFSATHKEEVEFRYSLGEAIEQGVLSDYDLTVPVTTEGHPYICLANLLLSQAGRFRRVLAYCNSVAQAKRFRQVLEILGLAAWHINGHTRRKERERVMVEFSGELQKTVHVLVTVQVLGEGVNIPNADTCMFVEPRASYVSIIQAIGRVLRPHRLKPMAHIVLPAIAMPTTSIRAAMVPPGLSDLAADSQSKARTMGSVEHVQSSESGVMQLDQGSVDDARVRAYLGATATNGSENSRDRKLTARSEETSRYKGSDGVPEPPPNGLQTAGLCTEGHAAQRAEGGFNNNDNAPRPGDSRSPTRTSMTRDRHRAELGPAALHANFIQTTHEVGPVVPIPSSSGVTPFAMTAFAANTAVGSGNSGFRTNIEQHDTERVRALIPGSTTAFQATALAACKQVGTNAPDKGINQTKASWDAALRGSSAARRPSIDSGAGPAGLREGRRDGAEFSGPNSQSPASMIDGQQGVEGALQTHPAPPASVMATATAFQPLLAQGSPSRQLPVATAGALEAAPVPRHHGTGLGPSISVESKENLRILMHRRASKLQTTGDTLLFGGGHADQLDRFLQAITQADRRLVEKDIRQLQCRLWVMDSRLQQTNMPQLLARDVLYRLALVLQQQDAFDLQLQAVEHFTQEHGRLPRQMARQLEERTLGKWLHNTGYKLKKNKLSAERVQKLLNSSCSRLRARAAKWLETDATVSFQQWMEELRQFVHAHRRMPSRGKARPMSEKRLLKNLLGAVQPANRKREKRLQLLENIDPSVSDWVKSRREQKTKVQAGAFRRQLGRLVEFVGVNQRLPKRCAGELELYDWLCRQRRQLDHLPAEFQAKLFDAHPAIAVFLES